MNTATTRTGDITRYTAVLICLIAVSACGTPRKACRKAQKHIAKAVWLCPEALRADTSGRSVSVQLPGDTITDTLRWSDADVHAIMADCDQLREALASERDLYATVLINNERQVAQAKSDRNDALSKLRTSTCRFEPFTVSTGRTTVRIRPGSGVPLVTIEEHPVSRTVNCPPCPPQVTLGEVHVNGPTGKFYRIGFWSLLIFLIILALLKYGPRIVRWIAGAGLLLVFMSCGPSQRIVITEADHAPGKRSLLLNILVHDADSVYVRVYSDGERLLDDVYGSSFQLQLGTYVDYQVLISDGERTKRLSIHELSDDMVEVYPLLEVDMNRTGNLLLIKPSSGKYGWIEMDVGMSRRKQE